MRLLYYLLQKKNAKEILLNLKENHSVCPNYNTILKTVENTRKIISEYLKYSYKVQEIGGEPELDRTEAIDEALIIDYNDNQIWIICAIDTTNKNVLLDIIPQRNSENIKIFITNYILSLEQI